MRHSLRSTLTLGATGLILLQGCAREPASEVSADSATGDDCSALSWFPHESTPMPNSEGFVGDSQGVFHQWSWQAFLWLTQDDGTGEPRFLSFTRPADLYGEQAGSAMLPRPGKSQDPEPMSEFLQAGTDGIMTDQAGRPIYYSLYVDPVFEAFVRSNDLTDPDSLLALDPGTNFPVGAMTLKASWKIVEEGEDASGFFTLQSDVYELANRRGTIVIDTTRSRPATLALVGFHVAGSVAGHPEMIWATFEHVDNAPSVFTHANIDDSIAITDTVSDRDWTFYAAGTPRSECNVNTASSNRRRLDPATQTITPVTQICREYEFGNLPTNDTAAVQRLANQNDANVRSINGHVADSLAATDVWRNYMEVGAIWFSDTMALTPGDPLDGLCVAGSLRDGACVDASGAATARLIGSLRLSNSTIETFTQSQSTMYNCFRCHNTAQRLYTASAPSPGQIPSALPAKNVNISHILVNGFFRNQEE